MNHLTKDIVKIHHSRVLHLLVEKECSSVNEIVRSEATLRSLVRLPHSKVQEIALPNLLFGHRIRMNKQMALILTHVLADISQQSESGAETLLRSFFETDVHLAMGRVSMSRGKTLPEALHSGRRSLEKHSNSLRMPKSDRGPFLVSDCEPAGILLEPLPKLTEDIERKMMALPFKREGEDELALLARFQPAGAKPGFSPLPDFGSLRAQLGNSARSHCAEFEKLPPSVPVHRCHGLMSSRDLGLTRSVVLCILDDIDRADRVWRECSGRGREWSGEA